MTHLTCSGAARHGCQALLLACALLLGAGGARADDEDLAKSYFTLGKELFSRSDYEGAYKQFEKAYELSPKPALLFNMARCQESLGQHQAAIGLYKQYLATRPDKPELIEARIANLEQLLAKQQAAEADRSAGGTGTGTGMGMGTGKGSGTGTGTGTGTSTSTSAGTSAGKSTKVTAADLAAESDAVAEAPARPWRLPGWITVGAGGALIVSGIVLEALAAGKASELEEANEAGREYASVADRADSGQTLETAGIVTLAAGGVAAVAGAVMLILDLRGQGDERRAWLAPSWTQTGALVSGGFSF